METEELCCINISPLVTTPFAVQWSPDNHISIIAERGVHIFELEPSPMCPEPTVKFARSFIYPSDILPAQAFVKEIDSIIWKLDREQVYSLFMEEAITSKLDGTNDTISRITKVAWSPKDLISPSRCMLAISTAAGAVELLHKVSNEWYSICNVSSLWLNIVRSEIKLSFTNCKRLENRYTMIVESLRQLQACCVTWSKLFKMKNTSYAYLCVAYRSGHISIWKVPRISNFNTNLQPVLVARIDLNISVKVNVLCWITVNDNQYLLIIGYFDGRICGVRLKYNDNNNNLEIVSIEKYIDPDRMTVNYLYVISQDQTDIKVLVVKSTYFLLMRVSLRGTWKNMQHLQVGFNITGIAPITTQQFLITTQNNKIFVLDTQHDLTNIDVKSHLLQTHDQYLGIAQSPNKVMFANITSPNMIYDHLVTREPSTVHIFTLKGEKWDPLSIINNSASLTNIWDCMEVLRVKAAKVEDPSTVLCPTTQNFELLYNLRVSMWMTVMINVCNMKKPIPNMDHIRQSRISRSLPSIFIYCACAYLDTLTKRNILSENQALAVNLLRRYLKMYLADNHEKDNDRRDENNIVREILNATASYSDRAEKCNLCGDAIEELFWNVTSCPSGHKLARCITTLLQITSLEYRVCPICHQIFHSCLQEVYEEPRCQFCDVPVLCNEYAIDVEKSELYGKNLSRINIAESSKELDTEELPQKQRRGKINTFDAITNDGELDKI